MYTQTTAGMNYNEVIANAYLFLIYELQGGHWEGWNGCDEAMDGTCLYRQELEEERGDSVCMGADASMVAVLMAINSNHRPPWEQRAHNPSRLLDAWMHVQVQMFLHGR
jgi:hypothetical protein